MRDKITLLPPATAQKIAAGEVIDRPEAVVRELLDNAIDAGATSIELHIKRGGTELIQVIDNGEGMSKTDLSLCWSSHATSKITTFDDLESLHTMGFRGEALYSIAACAKLTISSAQEGEQGYTLTVHSGEFISLNPSGQERGTSVVVSDLFYSIPARKKFLKRPSAETNNCKKTFLSKLIPFPHIEGKLYVDGKLKFFLPSQSLGERVAQTHNLSDVALFKQVEREGATFSITAILGDPSLARHDRSKIAIYLGKRPIQEFSLVQAVTYGYNSFLPGGLFPVATIAIETDPKLVDVNIHPAKREVRIKNLPEIHHELSHMIKEHFGMGERGLPSFRPSFDGSNGGKPTGTSPGATSGCGVSSGSNGHENIGGKQSGKHGALPTVSSSELNSLFSSDTSPAYRKRESPVPYGEIPKGWVQEARNQQEYRLSGTTGGGALGSHSSGTADTRDRDSMGNDGPGRQPTDGEPSTESVDFHYLGQLFGVFLLVEQGEDFLLIDQHATHERIIFEQLIADKEPQPLLLPIPIFPDESEERLIEKQNESYASLGIQVEKRSPGHWEIVALPQVMQQSDSVIAHFITSQQGTLEELQKLLFAKISCTAAIKEGDYLDSQRAIALIQQAFKLHRPRCPHGRPIWTSLTRDELYQKVGRIV